MMTAEQERVEGGFNRLAVLLQMPNNRIIMEAISPGCKHVKTLVDADFEGFSVIVDLQDNAISTQWFTEPYAWKDAVEQEVKRFSAELQEGMYRALQSQQPTP